MVVALVALPVGRVHGQRARCAVAVGQRLGDALGQFPALGRGQLGGQGHQYLTGHAGILANLGGFGPVPQLGGWLRGHPFGRKAGDVFHASAPPVVVDFAGTLVGDLFAVSIGSGGGGRPAPSPADCLDAG